MEIKMIKTGLLQNQFGEEYEFEKDDVLGFVLWEYYKGKKQKYISFTLDPQLEVDFILPSFYCEKHLSSKFNKSLMVAIKTKDGRKSISGNEYKEFIKDEVVVAETLNDQTLKTRLKEEFLINL